VLVLLHRFGEILHVLLLSLLCIAHVKLLLFYAEGLPWEPHRPLFSAYCVCSVDHIVAASFLLLFLDMCGDRFALCVVQSVLAIKFDYW
jgi:hypothetical protein